MKFKKLIESLFEDDSTKDISPEEMGLSNSSNIYVKNGKFYAADKDLVLHELPPAISKKLAAEYHKQKRRQLFKDKGLDKEKEKEKNMQRMEKQGELTIDDLEAEQRNWKKSQIYKASKESAAEFAFKKRRAAMAKKEFRSADALAKELGMDIKKFMKNQLYTPPSYDTKIDYDETDPFERIDSRVITPGETVDYNNPRYDNSKDKRPLVLFYFDRSCSFNQQIIEKYIADDLQKNKKVDPSYYAAFEIIKRKVQLGYDIQNMFKTFEDKIDVKTFYFSKYVYTTEQEALDRGGNNGPNLMNHIAAQIKGRKSNVVILTDSDNGDELPVVPIDGSVWLIFSMDYDKGSLARHFRKLTPKTQIQEYFYK